MRQHCSRGRCSRLATVVLTMVCIAATATALDWNVGTKRIVIPGNNADSGTAIVPTAVVVNYGDSAASFPVLFYIGTVYADTQNVTNLNPGDSTPVPFDTWIPIQRGPQTAVCSTALAADESTANDRISRNFTVRVRDVSVDSIMAPKGRINLAVALTPQARVTNHGTGNATFQARIYIGPSVVESAFVFGLASGASQTVSFPSWTPDSLGTFAVRCTAALNFDQVSDNNQAQDSFTVITLAEDAGVMRVVAPRGIFDSGAVLAPQAMVRNFGTDAISFSAVFSVGTYVDTQQVTDLASLDSALVTFADWTAEPVGWLATRCSTALADDSNAANDVRSDSVRVIIRTTDVGAVRFIAPPDTVDSGTVVAPQVVVYNYGLDAQSFPVRLTVGTFFPIYADTQQVTDLASHESLTVTFKDDTVRWRGLWGARCSTALAGDQVTANDKVTKNIFQRVRDVGATSISAPLGTVPRDTVVVPTARLLNYGNTVDSFPVIFRIGTFYEDTIRTNDSVVTFKPCTLSTAGTFATMCSTAMVGDVDSTNDAVFDSVVVTSPGISASDNSALPRVVTLKGSGPAAGRVAIEYGLPRSTVIRLEVFDACGRRVRVLASGIGEPGYHSLAWNCVDAGGRSVAEGAYFVRLVADDVTLTSKVVKTE
jgi:hypothetical protein